MNIHYLQHVPFEGLGSMEQHLQERRHTLTHTLLYAEPALPAPDSMDVLIIMGGPMSVHDEEVHPWLASEKLFIKQVIELGKPVLGICLGAQLIAEVLGARVFPNAHREIGWFPVERTVPADESSLAAAFPEFTEAFHWHGETFDIPAGAIHLARSVACPNQGFIYRDKVLALQFHLETTAASAQALIEHCASELDGSRYVQSADSMLADAQRFTVINALMKRVLTIMEERIEA